MNEYIPGDQVQACRDVAQWTEDVARDLTALQTTLDLPPTWAERITHWIQYLGGLYGEAQRLTDPRVPWLERDTLTEQLVREAHWLFGEITPLLRHPAVERRLTEPIPGLQIAGAEGDDPQSSQAEPQPRRSAAPTPIGEHPLPPLPYAYNALEPYIDEATMRLHHDRHHRSYVEGLNRAERMMAQARTSGDYALIKHWEREAAFNGAGHYLHTIFWHNMSPGGGGEPVGAIAEQIRHDFGDFRRFAAHFSAAAEQVEGGGWALLVWAPRAHRLEILTAEKHQNLSQWDVIPLLVLDVWEHAYYLKHQNDRRSYIADWWHLVNWPDVNHRFLEARRVQWTPA